MGAVSIPHRTADGLDVAENLIQLLFDVAVVATVRMMAFFGAVMAMAVVMSVMMAVLMMSILVMAVCMMPVAIMAALGVMLAVVAFRSMPTGVHALTVVPVHAMMVLPMMAVTAMPRRILTVMAVAVMAFTVMIVTTVSGEMLAVMTFTVVAVMAFAMMSTAMMAMTTLSSEVLAVVTVMALTVMAAVLHLAEGAMTFVLAAGVRVVTPVGVHLVSVAMRAAGFGSTGHRVMPGAAKRAAAVAGKVLHKRGVQLTGFFGADDALHDFAHLAHPLGIEEMSRATRRRRMMAFACVMPIVPRAAVGLSIGAVMIAVTAITRTGVAGATIAGRRRRRPFAVALAGWRFRLLIGRANLGDRRGCLC
ncbi:MAG TPA: hypothetical protein VHV55_06545 [Pirellulales bacterium]|nr:hypothetical protein [Pirellulales bacterium]